MDNTSGREKRVIMESTFRAILMNGEKLEPYYLNDKGYVDVGGFSVYVPGYKNPIPFDFEATVKVCNDDGTYSYGNWDGFLERIFDVDPCHEEDWTKNRLELKDITAQLLAGANQLEDFYFCVSDMSDNDLPCFLEVKEIVFTDEWEKRYFVSPEVLAEYNQRRVAEQVAEFIEKTNHLRCDHVVRQSVVESYLHKFQSDEPSGVLALIDSIQNGVSYKAARAESDFLIDCMLEVSKSKDKIFRVGLTAYGNPDYGENPYKTLSGTDSMYVYKDSIQKCQNAVGSYIENNGLGSRNWCGGMVFKGGEYAGNISYNGRFWNKESEYGSLARLIKTDIPKIDAKICGYGKNLFQRELDAGDKSLENKINEIKKPSKEKKAPKTQDLEL